MLNVCKVSTILIQGPVKSSITGKKSFISLIIKSLHTITWLYVCTLSALGRKPEGVCSADFSPEHPGTLSPNRNLNNAHRQSAERTPNFLSLPRKLVCRQLYDKLYRLLEHEDDDSM